MLPEDRAQPSAWLLDEYRKSGRRAAQPYLEPESCSGEVPLEVYRQRITVWIENASYWQETILRQAYEEAFLDALIQTAEGNPNSHSAIRPFCDVQSCQCHSDVALIQQCITEPVNRGELTDEEATLILNGKQV